MGYSVIRGYRHIQSVASDTWVINHNMGIDYPIVDVFYDNSGTLTKLVPLNVEFTDTNTVTLTFSNAITGEAEVV